MIEEKRQNGVDRFGIDQMIIIQDKDKVFGNTRHAVYYYRQDGRQRREFRRSEKIESCTADIFIDILE